MVHILRATLLYSSLFIALLGCNFNPTSSEKDSVIGDNYDGLQRLNNVSGISLVTPSSSPNISTTPTIRISGLKSGDTVYVYSDSSCSSLLATGTSTGSSLDITLPALSAGNHTIYAKRRWALANIESDCSTLFLSYEVSDIILDISDDDAQTTPSHAVTVKWSSPNPDFDSGLVIIEIAIGTTSGATDIHDWTEIPNGITLDPKEYQVQDGVDGFSISLSQQTNYYTSLRFVDALGNSTTATSDAWTTFLPSKLSGIQLWLDATDASTLADAEGDRPGSVDFSSMISEWSDKSPNGISATAAGSLRPTYIENAINTSMPAIRLDGIDDVISLSAEPTARSVWVVIKYDGLPQTNWSTIWSGILDNNASLGCYHVNYKYIEGVWTHPGCRGGTWYESGISINAFSQGPETTWEILHVDASENLAFEQIGRDRNYSNRNIGADIAEIIVRDSVATTNDRIKVEGYLACKWGLQGELPVDHTYKSSCP